MVKLTVNSSRIPKGVTQFDGLAVLEVDKLDIFKLGVLKQEVPKEHVHDSDFLYLQSKVAGYHSILGDFIECSENAITNLATDDRMTKDVSEFIGIALGIKSAIESFGIRQEVIERIPPPSRKVKYMDYWFPHKIGRVELETKGTTAKTVTAQVKDILAKKKSSKECAFRYGTVAAIRKSGSTHPCAVHLCDDPPDEDVGPEADTDVPSHYLAALSLVADNRLYNKVRRLWSEGESAPRRRVRLKGNFFGTYVIDGHTYYGEFFDHRLIQSNIAALNKQGESADVIFQALTRSVGRMKVFMGIHSHILDVLLAGGGLASALQVTLPERRIEQADGITRFIDTDGLLVVVSSNHGDDQIEAQFDDFEVKRRLRLFVAYERGDPPECGEPCRSREKEGKPCEIKTYRGTCHFHR